MTRELQTGELLKGTYKIDRNLGQGAFGKTYLAKDTHCMDELCVVKQLAPTRASKAGQEKATELFQREAKALKILKSVKHPQIPQLIAFFDEDEDSYIVQEFIDGKDLSNETEIPWNENNVIYFLKDVLPILGFIHKNEIIHRDIKPHNLMRRETDKKIVLIDFGAVKIKPKGNPVELISQQGTLIGTHGYTAPELAEDITKECGDIYSLGVTAIQFLTGKKPNEMNNDNIEKICKKIIDDKKVSESLADILTKMVKQNYKERYQTVEEVLQAIKKMPPLFIPDLPSSIISKLRELLREPENEQVA